MEIINEEVLKSHGNVDGRTYMLKILKAGLQAADPYYNTKKLLRREGGILHIGYDEFVPVGSPLKKYVKYDLEKDIDRILVFGAGKGIQRVALAIEEVLGDYLTGGMVILKHGDEDILTHIHAEFGGHPVPDEDCVTACGHMLALIRSIKLTERDLVFTIFANGGSSLCTLPADGLELQDIQRITEILQIEKGLPTIKVNHVRTQLDLLKGGRITRMLSPAKMVHIVPIDLNEPNSFGVPGYEGCTRHNIWIHSLPTMGSREDALNVLKESDTLSLVSPKVADFLENGADDNPVLSLEEFEQMDCMVFGIMPTELSFVPAVMSKAGELGFESHFLMRRTLVEARAAGTLLGQIARNVSDLDVPFKAPCALVLTGELLVAVEGTGGIGGRNQEFALSTALAIDGNKRIVVGAVDTDGTDGPGGIFHSDAHQLGCDNLAGGIVDGYTIEEAKALNINIKDALKKHDTSKALWMLDSGIWTSQNISVQDLIVLLIMKESD